MSKDMELFELAYSWSVMREFRPVLQDLSGLISADMSNHVNHEKLENLFASYFGSLASESQKFDRPECLIYYRLAQICSPSVFKNPLGKNVEDGIRFLQNPVKSINDPLYAISRDAQAIAPGSVRLLSARTFFLNNTIPYNLHPVIMECDIEGGTETRIARIPIVLTGDPSYARFLDVNIPIINRMVEALQNIHGVASVDVKHLPRYETSMKKLVPLHHEANILDWPLAFPEAELRSPIVGVLRRFPRLGEEETWLQSISITVGEIEKEWEVIPKSWSLLPDPVAWKYWSFNNTVYQIRNVATENMLHYAGMISQDILSLPDINMEKDFRTATLAVHLPILLAAAFADNIPVGITSGLAQHHSNFVLAERRRTEAENGY